MARGNGEGTIYKRKDGLWCGQISLGYDPKTGKIIRKTFYGKKSKVVQNKMNEAKAKYMIGNLRENTRITLDEWLKTWLEIYKKPNLRVNTYSSYSNLIESKIAQSIGYIKLKNLRSTHIINLLNELTEQGYTRTVSYVKTLLHGALKQAVRESLIDKNPVEYIEVPKKSKKNDRFKVDRLDVLDKEQQQMFVNALKNEYYETFFLTLLYTGMRKSEALGLKWSNIDFNNRAINVEDTVVFTDEGMVEQLNDTKTESSKRTIPILDKLIFYLKKHKLSQAELKLKVGQVYVDERYVFASYTGKPYHDRNIRRALNRITRNAGLGHFTPHTLRHTFGTRLMESGVQPTVIRDLLGHSDIRTTLQIYTHTTEDSKEKAIEIMAKSLQI